MTEHDDVQLIDEAFHQLSASLGPAVRPPGGVRDLVARRRRTRVTTATVAAGLVAVLPVAAFMGTGRGQPGRDPAPVAASVGATTGTPSAPSASATPSPSASPSAPVPARGGGPVTLAELTAAPVAVPEWPWSGSSGTACADGLVRLASSAKVGGARVGVVQLHQADLDGDAELETAALLRCGHGAEQVVAFDRDADGRVATLGQVVATTADMPAIVDIDARPRGGVTATVADSRTATDRQRQERQYAWDGERYGQVGGATSFPVRQRPVDLGLTVADPVAGPVSGPCEDAMRDVSVTFTVKNHSRQPSDRFHLEWRGGAFLPNGSYDGPYWLDTPGHPAQDGGHRGLKPGESVDLTFTFKIDACVTEWGFTTDIHSGRPDPDTGNNHVLWWLRTG
ncbi:hypothetical protein ACSNOB_05655 [Micromonospora sp. URMC 106]|uniref:hypothetical protein n=1 Tax=Micromonospora sp. URMC 106 TaxID=3423408 RepID=UPI003F1C3BA4